MSYSAASHLDPVTLSAALELAHALRSAATAIDDLTSGSGGRNHDAAMVVQQWLGPRRDVFDQLITIERHTARTARDLLLQEAEAWTQFWVDATNAYQDRQHREAMARHQADLERYQTHVQTVVGAAEGGAAPLPGPPAPPRAPRPVVAPLPLTSSRTFS